MSLEELEFYKCKLCSVKLLAGKYCIDCSKKSKADKIINPHLNTKRQSPGYPFIQPTFDREYNGDFITDTTTDTTAGTTGIPIWTNFTTAGNAITDSGAAVTVGTCTTMDFNFGTASQIGQDMLSSRRKKSRR